MIQLVHGDDFYGPVGDRWHTWTPDQGYHGYFDHERLAREVLEPLRRGLRACYQIYDWGRNRLQPGGEVAPLGVVVVEGVSAAT